MRLVRSSLVAIALAASASVAACQGCHVPGASTPADASGAKPTLRLYVLSDVAGALEPCGCTKDQLGGIDHLAALIGAEAAAAPNKLVLEAGSLLFRDPTLPPDARTQATWKAETLAQCAHDLGLAAWAPGANDWAAGSETLAAQRDVAGAVLVAANLEAKPEPARVLVRDVAGMKVGIVAVSDPKDRAGRYPDAVRSSSALDALRAGIADVKKQGARILVALAALPRGEALRLADSLPELNVLIVGKPYELGEGNDATKAPTLAGSTVVVEAANHLQTIGIIDLYVRDGRADAPLSFADAGGVAKAEELLGVSSRIRDLETRINNWELDKNVKREDIAARKADLEKLRADKARLEAPDPAPQGSYFRYRTVEIRERLGSDPRIAERMLGYYKRVNDHNRVEFADRKPEPPEKGAATYVGVERCTECHDDPRKVWDATPHAHAYPTLQKGFKEYNLDCVSCHVTGYGKPGGSTVTFNASLQNVQCEECHGPGSLHVQSPKKKGLIIDKPKPESCVSSCHHPPHVENFDAAEKIKLVLGPGHGQK